ncbi:MAG: hypothetical protein ACYS22_11670 [Planctomycetota bacterium]|jgi:hypothetical protein
MFGTEKARGSYGACGVCERRFSRTGITRHLKACLARRDGNSSQLTETRFHISVSSPVLRHYWMHLDVAGTAELADLDQFLRTTWLECCGHLSEFRIKAHRKPAVAVDMNARLDEILEPGLPLLEYDYDFGSTTRLLITVHTRHEAPRHPEKVQLLSRNEPIAFKCEACDAPATGLCRECQWDADLFLCGVCARSHECGEEMMAPIVNSPRVGVCGYVG